MIGTEALSVLHVFHHVVGELLHVPRCPEREPTTLKLTVSRSSAFTIGLKYQQRIHDTYRWLNIKQSLWISCYYGKINETFNLNDLINTKLWFEEREFNPLLHGVAMRQQLI